MSSHASSAPARQHREFSGLPRIRLARNSAGHDARTQVAHFGSSSHGSVGTAEKWMGNVLGSLIPLWPAF
jgi:hypothetical protein